jgi:phytepsin
VERGPFRRTPCFVTFSWLCSWYAHGMINHSIIWNKLLASRVARETSLEVRNSLSFQTRVIPDPSEIHEHRTPTVLGDLDQSLFPRMDDVLASFASNGPLLPRLILTGALASPIVAISLQRDTVDIGGPQGVLSIGELPAGIATEDLTWVPLRGYTAAEGGLPAPDESPDEVLLNAHIFSTQTNIELDIPHHLGSCH